MDQRDHAALQAHRRRRAAESGQPHGGLLEALHHPVARVELRECIEPELVDDLIELVLRVRPIPGRPQVEALRHRGDAAAGLRTRLQQHEVPHPDPAQKMGCVEAAQAGADEGHAR